MQRKRPARHVHASSIALTPKGQHLLGHACHGLSSSVPPPSVQLPPTKPSLVGLPAQRRPNEVDVAALSGSLEVRAERPTAHRSGMDICACCLPESILPSTALSLSCDPE